MPYLSPAASSASKTPIAASFGTTSSYPRSPVYPVRHTTTVAPSKSASWNDM
jgi:hypothetical protein